MIFGGGTLLDQDFSAGIEYQHRKGPMQETLPMGFHLFHGTNFMVILIDEYYMLHQIRFN